MNNDILPLRNILELGIAAVLLAYAIRTAWLAVTLAIEDKRGAARP